jgi:hypothetical protein
MLTAVPHFGDIVKAAIGMVREAIQIGNRADGTPYCRGHPAETA